MLRIYILYYLCLYYYICRVIIDKVIKIHETYPTSKKKKEEDDEEVPGGWRHVMIKPARCKRWKKPARHGITTVHRGQIGALAEIKHGAKVQTEIWFKCLMSSVNWLTIAQWTMLSVTTSTSVLPTTCLSFLRNIIFLF